MHVCLHFGHYTWRRDSSRFRQHWYALQARDFSVKFWTYWRRTYPGSSNSKLDIHMQSFPGEELDWWNQLQPTPEELRLSGGLQVEDWPHARQVERLSIQLFEATRPLHQLDERALCLLERAAFLHNTGMLIEARRHHKHSYHLIKGTTLPDFTEEERHEIACIARYHRRALPSVSHEEFAALSDPARERVSALAALVRIADALDWSHDGRVLRLAANEDLCDDHTWMISLWRRSPADLDAELEHAYEKADLFEKVFQRKLQFLIQDQE
jgi:HD superfamily phosphodiesterase